MTKKDSDAKNKPNESKGSSIPEKPENDASKTETKVETSDKELDTLEATDGQAMSGNETNRPAEIKEGEGPAKDHKIVPVEETIGSGVTKEETGDTEKEEALIKDASQNEIEDMGQEETVSGQQPAGSEPVLTDVKTGEKGKKVSDTPKTVKDTPGKKEKDQEPIKKEVSIKSENSDAALWAGSIFWVVLIGAIALWLWAPEGLDVSISIASYEAAADSVPVDVVVQHDGMILKDGVASISINSGFGKEHLFSEYLKYNDDKFHGSVPYAILKNADSKPLIFEAAYDGQYKDDDKMKPIHGSSKLYVGMPSPPSKVQITIITVVGILLIIILVTVFTGTITKKKFRAQFSIMYFIAILALVVPLIVVLATPNSAYLNNLMIRAPIGLVSCIAPPNIMEKQWLFNIGGTISETEIKNVEEIITNNPPEKTLTEPEISISNSLVVYELKGGLAIPFYVIMLSLLGAAINMTRKVPNLQNDRILNELPGKKDMSAIESLIRAPGSALDPDIYYKNEEIAKKASKIRSKLIRQFMYFLSAPFLGIAVYYLMQATSERISTPVMVVMSFATGLMADRVVGAIRKFAGNVFGRIEDDEDEEIDNTLDKKNNKKNEKGNQILDAEGNEHPVTDN